MSGGYYVDEGFENAQNDPLFSVKQIGTTHAITEANALTQLKAEIFRGAGNIEMSANGYGRPGQGLGNMTFEAIDPLQRQAIAELARINEVNLTTHATFKAGNLSGFNPQQGFNEQFRKSNIDEIKKAIDFSAEAANGGSVVVHTGEFTRPVGLDKSEGGFKGGKDEFEMFPDEDKEAEFLLVNRKTGKMIHSVKANEVIYQPIYEEDPKTGEDKILRDEKDKPMYDDFFREDIIVRHREKNNISETDMSDSDLWKTLSEKQKKAAHIKIYATDEQGNIRTQPVSFEDFKKAGYKKGKDLRQVTQDFYKEQIQGQIQGSLGQAREIERSYKQGLTKMDQLRKQYKELKKSEAALDPNLPEAQKREFLLNQMGPEIQAHLGANGDPFKFISEQIEDTQTRVLYGRESGTSGRKQAKELLRQINESQTIGDYAHEKSMNTVVELGKYAIDQTEHAKRTRKHDKINQIALTLENIFPENGYGSHPEELAALVKEGRKRLKEDLIESRGMDKREAKELSDNTIKITLDTGHLNIWRKYFKAKEGESKAKTDKRFKKWYTKQVETLAEDGLIGNLHIADNLGWDDAHLAAGTGNAPVREVMEIMKKHGYTDVVTSEGGFDRGPSGEFGLQSTWHMAGATAFAPESTYNGMQAGEDSWLNPNGGALYNMMEGYHGAPGGSQGGYSTQITKPNFVFKGYAPDGEDWRPWSGSGME